MDGVCVRFIREAPSFPCIGKGVYRLGGKADGLILMANGGAFVPRRSGGCGIGLPAAGTATTTVPKSQSGVRDKQHPTVIELNRVALDSGSRLQAKTKMQSPQRIHESRGIERKSKRSHGFSLILGCSLDHSGARVPTIN